jgi:hypothetical protein
LAVSGSSWMSRAKRSCRSLKLSIATHRRCIPRYAARLRALGHGDLRHTFDAYAYGRKVRVRVLSLGTETWPRGPLVSA